MSEKKKHINPEDKASAAFVPKTTIEWDKSKEDVWQLLSDKIDRQPPLTTKKIRYSSFLRYAVAALIVLMIGVPAIMRLYTKTISCERGAQLSAILPDGSSVVINANSSIAFHPLWWSFSRTVDLKGEAFFEVKKGERFQVLSTYGSTTVLGTSFNIFSRNKEYEVTCFSGKVEVASTKNNNTLTLLPNQKARLLNDGRIEKKEIKIAAQSMAWVEGRFIFTSTPINKVFEEIERQYNIIIQSPKELDFMYTGNFDKKKDVKKVLNLVCKPFDIKFVEKTKNEYQIIPQQ